MHMMTRKVRPLASVSVWILMVFCCRIATAAVTPQVITDKKVYPYGETITVNFSNAPGDDRDWICIVPAGSPDTEGGNYQYIPRGMSQGVLTFAPPSPGTYEVRAYYHYSRRGYVVSARYVFSVAGSAEYEKAMALHSEAMERKLNPHNPLEANLSPEKGLVYVVREPWTITGDIKVEIKIDEKPIVVLPNSGYFLLPVPAGDFKFTTGRHTVYNAEKNIGEEVWSASSGEAAVRVKSGYVSYLKLKVIPMGGTHLNPVPYREGADLIERYKLNLIQ